MCDGGGSVTAKSDSSVVKTIRLSDTRIEAILEKLDACPDWQGASKRGAERFSYRVKGCVVHMQMPGMGSSAAFLVPTRDISATGLSFLHGGFVHLSTQCVVQLISTHGTWENVEATVVRCEYKADMVHLVALQFKNPIDPGAYSPAATKTRILLAEDSPSFTRLAMVLLKKLNVEADHAENGKIAVALASKNVYDAILMDVEMPIMNGLEAVKTLRGQGYGGVIVAATALTQPDDKQRCLEAGCDRYMPKPYDLDLLRELIESLQQEPLLSSQAQDQTMVPLISTFVEELPKKLRALEECFAKEEKQKLEVLCRNLKGEAGGYGFEPISAAAKKVESAVIDKAPQGTLADAVNELSNLCCLARSSARETTRGADAMQEAETSGA